MLDCDPNSQSITDIETEYKQISHQTPTLSIILSFSLLIINTCSGIYFFKRDKSKLKLMLMIMLCFTCIITIGLSVCFLTKECKEVNYSSEIQYSQIEFFIDILQNKSHNIEYDDELSRSSRYSNDKKYKIPKYGSISNMIINCMGEINCNNTILSSNSNSGKINNSNNIKIGSDSVISMAFAMIILTVVAIAGACLGFSTSMFIQTGCMSCVMCIGTLCNCLARTFAKCIKYCFCCWKNLPKKYSLSKRRREEKIMQQKFLDNPITAKYPISQSTTLDALTKIQMLDHQKLYYESSVDELLPQLIKKHVNKKDIINILSGIVEARYITTNYYTPGNIQRKHIVKERRKSNTKKNISNKSNGEERLTSKV